MKCLKLVILKETVNLTYGVNFPLVYFEVYGCQMNVNDAEVIWSILKSHGYRKVNDIIEANIILLITCSIRDNAEQKVWNKLTNFNNVRKKNKSSVKIGLLGITITLYAWVVDL